MADWHQRTATSREELRKAERPSFCTIGRVLASAEAKDASGDVSLLAAGGEGGRLIRSIASEKTPLGTSASWPKSLRTTIAEPRALLDAAARLVSAAGIQGAVTR